MQHSVRGDLGKLSAGESSGVTTSKTAADAPATSWEEPTFEAINMSAEIGGYYDDFAAETAGARDERSANVRVQVLGSAAGGGFPQWNCACSGCNGLRSGAIIAAARTQDSLAVSVDGQAWYLLNASPDIRYQIESCRYLHPRSDSRAAARLLVWCSPMPISTIAWACSRFEKRSRW